MNITSFGERIISSYKTSVVLMILFAVGLAVATFVEKAYSTEVAKVFFYYSPIMFLIQFLLVINFIVVSTRYELFRKTKIAFIITHCALIVILVGALTTHIFGEEGSIHLRENETTDRMLVNTNHGSFYKKLPFSIKLSKFTLTRYPGSSSPSSYESIVEINEGDNIRTENISMNNVLDIKEYRLFQASYDTDEKGSILSVNKDLAGRYITYGGYLLLVIGFVMCFISKNSRFKYLIKELKSLNTTKTILVFLICISSFNLKSHSNNNISDILQTHKIPEAHAKKFGALLIQPANGRMKPINTFSSEILRKLHHKEKMGELNSDQFLLSFLTFKEMWMQVPFIYHTNKDVSLKFDIREDMCAYSELFDSNGFYKLEDQVRISHSKSPAARSKFDKDVIKLDEQINIVHQLAANRLLNIFPKKDDEKHKWYASGDDLSIFFPKDSIYIANLIPQYIISIQNSIKTGDWSKSDEIVEIIQQWQIDNNTTLEINSKQVKAELLFNQLNIFKHCQKAYLIIGGLLLILSFIEYLNRNKWIKYAITSLSIFVGIAFLFHSFGLALRGYIGGYAPWSNSYETMIYVSLISVLAGFIFIRQSKVTFALSTLFAGVILFVSSLNWMDPQINSLIPVLKSPWLMIHVAVIVAAYSFFGISCLLGITNLIILAINKKDSLTIQIKKLSVINEISLLIGLALMTIGTFLGAVWANESWGRYWGWDSKETWALITILIYACVTHLRLIKRWDKVWLFNLLSILAFLSVLMTYFGVNYILTGLHSYA